MNKHEEAKKNLNDFILWLTMIYGVKKSALMEIANVRELFAYFEEAEATEKELKELKKNTSDLLKLIREMGVKLSTIGEEE